MSAEARASAQRYAWPHVAERIEGVYEQAVDVPDAGLRARSGPRGASVPSPPAAGHRFRPAASPRSSPRPPPRAGAHRLARRIAIGAAGVLGVGLTLLAAQRIGVDNVVSSIVGSDLGWVLVATALMCASLLLRAGAWYAISRSALPNTPLRRRDVTSATMIGVLMSATLPARLGEPARAMVLSRRTGRVRETFPVLLGTLVSQTVLNIAALVLLGVIIVSTTDLFHSNTERLFLFSMAPLLLLVAVVLAPTVVKGRTGLGADRPRRPRDPRRPDQGPPRAHRSSAIRAGARPPPFCSSPHGACSCSPASRCSRRSASTMSPRSGSAPPPRFSSRSTSPPRSQRRRRTSASSSSRRSAC